MSFWKEGKKGKKQDTGHQGKKSQGKPHTIKTGGKKELRNQDLIKR